MGNNFRLDKKGVGAILAGQCAPVVNAAAQKLAQAAERLIDDDDVPVDIDYYTTDRKAASVAIAHPTGVELQAKHGVLTKAAAAAGLEVTRR